ncbi:MAG: MarC family protein [Phycisphaerales bacterium JB037]
MLSDAVLLFFIIDPFGLIPFFVATLRRVEPARRRLVLVRELVISLGVLLAFLLLGRHLLGALHISEPALTIAGAIILLLIALPMIFPTIKLSMESEETGEPFIVPLAIPFFVGPGAMALVMVMGTGDSSWGERFGAVGIAWAAASVVLVLGERIAGVLGRRGLVTMERLMGMLAVAIAVEMFLGGISAFMEAQRAVAAG